MPDLFSPYALKGVTLRNRIAMSPMTMYRSAADSCIGWPALAKVVQPELENA